MKFIIRRTSDWDDIKPCDEAFKDTHERWHERTCTEEYFNLHHSNSEGLWRSNGKNHSITKEGNIIRQENDIERWTIEINNFEELINFNKKYGDLVIQDKSLLSNSPAIEIYDDYRE